jgi:HK97 gp10 family phage protein
VIKINKVNNKKVTDAINKYGNDAVVSIGEVVKATALDMELTAKSLAPVDNGTLRQSIMAEQQESPLHYKVTAYMPYSAYQEFGTGGKVIIPQGWSDKAKRFIGKGLRKINLTPQPFMYPAFIRGRAMFNKEIKEALKRLNNKFNG